MPAAPARAALMVALSVSRLLCSAIEVMALTTSLVSAEEAPSRVTVSLVAWAALTAWEVTAAALEELVAI